MTVEEFKFIFYMEYWHRMWGRLIGGVFAVPAIYFWSKGYFNRGMKIRVGIFGTLIALQGLMGWYMVKSGLENRFDDPNDVPRVSQYRLASHLTFALVLYTLFLWSGLDHLLPAQKIQNVTAAALKFKRITHASKLLIFLTAVSGISTFFLNLFSLLIFLFKIRCICCWLGRWTSLQFLPQDGRLLDSH